MESFTEKMHLKERAEEDIYFARRDRELIAALHSKTCPAPQQNTLVADDLPVISRDIPPVLKESVQQKRRMYPGDLYQALRATRLGCWRLSEPVVISAVRTLKQHLCDRLRKLHIRLCPLCC
jgi:hypothetical protein